MNKYTLGIACTLPIQPCCTNAMPRHIFLLLHQIRYKLASSLHPRWYFNRPSLPLRARNPISIPRTPTPPSIQTGPLPRRPHLLDDEFPSGCLDACGPCLCFRCGPPPRLSALGFVFEQAGGVAFGDGAAFAGEGGIRGFVLREGDEVGVGDAAVGWFEDGGFVAFFAG